LRFFRFKSQFYLCVFEEADWTTFYRTGVSTGYEQGPIYEVGPGSGSTNACTNYNQDEDVVFSIENAIGDSGAIYYKTEYDPTQGKDIAIVAGLRTLGFADTGNIVRSAGGGAKPDNSKRHPENAPLRRPVTVGSTPKRFISFR
jgi:hypothetical protein